MKQQRYQPSPFAAKTRQEQLEQWICWQQEQRMQQDARTLAQELPSREEAQSGYRPVQPHIPRHSQYDAVMNKMRQARRQAGQDTVWTG